MNPAPRIEQALAQTPTLQRDQVLAPEAQLLDQFSVRLHVFLLEVVQKSAAPPDELQEPAARVVILRMRAEMLRELVDALREERDLDLGRARVGLRVPVAPDDLQLCFLGEGHLSPIVHRARLRTWHGK